MKRTNQFSVSTTYNLGVLYPDIAKEWHIVKNKLSAFEVAPYSGYKVWWLCSKGHEWETVIKSRTRWGAKCTICFPRKATSNYNLSICYPLIAVQWNTTKNIDISPEQVTPHSPRKVWWRCQNNHEWQARIADRTNGVGCLNCSGRIATSTNNLLIQIPSLASQWNYTKNEGLLPENVTQYSSRKVWWLGKCGHEWQSIIANRSFNNQNCPYCCFTHTNLEKFVENKLSIEKYNKNPLVNCRYFPDFKLSDTIYLNVDGLYWHSEEQKEKDYHYKLREAFELENKRILQFYEDEVYNKWSIVESIINNALGKTTTKINGRDCVINNISNTDATDFYNNNHLMGSYSSARHFALIYKFEIVSLISVRLQQGTIEISRFATKLNTSVRGGFSKLLSHVIKLYNPSKVISFCDLRYATGKSYERLGFKLEHITQGWYWTDFKSRFNRLACKANNNKSEKENALEKNWYKIYDAGQAKYISFIN